jgi:hypothetical protein
MSTRNEKLYAMARRRGCYFTEVVRENGAGDEYEFVYLLYVLNYPEPIEFDDIDEAEFDIRSRPVVKGYGYAA